MNARLTRLMRSDRRWGRDGTGPHAGEVAMLIGCVVAFVALMVGGKL